ncbi:MAG: hypothetical protein HUU21_03875 [Polyangiaceae bacterium]|nr:hypothetical protein [Polyangiaceae bacterium]
MGKSDPYYFNLHFREGVLGRAWLNDLPLQKVPMHGPDSMHGGANHLLVPGKNRLALEIQKLPRLSPPPPPVPGEAPRERVDIMPAGMKVYQIKDPQAEPLEAIEMVSVELPAALGLEVWERPALPLYHEVEFDLPYPVPEPVYWRSPPVHFGCGGTPELVQAVTDVHNALMQRDLRRFLELLALKHEAYAAAFPGQPSAALDRQRSASEKFFALRYLVKPLDMSKVHFEPRSGGRVAYVSGWDDQPVLEAVAEDQPGLSLRANLLLTQHDGQWRVFG